MTRVSEACRLWEKRDALEGVFVGIFGDGLAGEGRSESLWKIAE